MVIGVLGVLMMTSEYSTGLVSSTFAAVPKRLPVLWGKAAVYTASHCRDGAGHAGRVLQHAGDPLRRPMCRLASDTAGVARAVIGSALYLTIAGLLGIGLGGIFRSTAAAVTSLTVILFVLPVIVFILPASVSNSIRPYLPGMPGRQS